MNNVTYAQLPVGTTFTLHTDQGAVELTSRGAGRKWLDITIGGRDGVLLSYHEQYRDDFEKFHKQLDTRGGVMEAAANEIGHGMTAVVMLGGSNYPFSVTAISVN